MKDFGVTFARLPLGYWNVVDMPGNPNGPSSEADRMGNLSKIMPASGYTKYIDQVFEFAGKYGIQILLDLHGAPGSQSGESNSGCSFKYSGEGNYYWDTDWNKLWTKNAVVALAKICQEKGSTCYGVEVLNEPAFPGGGLDRGHLLSFYQEAILAARNEGGLSMDVPMMIMEWGPHWNDFWKGRWSTYFPESKYGKVQLDTHIYDFQNTVQESEASWAANQFPLVKEIAAEVPLLIGEYTLSLNWDIPTQDLQGWASWINTNFHESGVIGGAHWMWNNKPRKFWSMRSMSTLETPGGIDWKQVFSSASHQDYTSEEILLLM